ncbi:MAG: iron-containing redox enzyme family protein [Propionibacteriaceae bacterium]
MALLNLITRPPEAGGAANSLLTMVGTAVNETTDIVADGDLQLTLFCLNALHNDGLDHVNDAWEWDAGLMEVRATIESAFEAVLRERIPMPERPATSSADAVAKTLFELAAQDKSPGLSRFVASKATKEQLLEFMIQRSVYQLREADPHTWAIPRLNGRAKAALVEIQTDEYGGGRPERMHAELFAGTMRGLGLDGTYGGYIDRVAPVTLASVNMMTMFGLHRRLRGAIVGHLAAFEMTSSAPNRMYGNGFRRLGFDNLTEYFDEHVEADAVHEQIAARDLAGGLVEAEPETLDDVLFGAAACLTMDGWVTAYVLGAWKAGRTSLEQSWTVAA